MIKKVKNWLRKYWNTIKVGLICFIVGLFSGAIIQDKFYKEKYPDLFIDNSPEWVDTDAIPYSQEEADKYLGDYHKRHKKSKE